MTSHSGIPVLPTHPGFTNSLTQLTQAYTYTGTDLGFTEGNPGIVSLNLGGAAPKTIC